MVISAWDFIESQLGFEVIDVLGSGFHGTVYLINAERPEGIKVTSDYLEAKCVMSLVDNQIASPHLPIVYEYGAIPARLGVEVPVDWGQVMAEDSAKFWYRKEVVEPLPWEYPKGLSIEWGSMGEPLDPWWRFPRTDEDVELQRRVTLAISKLRGIGVDPDDPWNLDNWGYRPESDAVVYMDLSCSVEE